MIKAYRAFFLKIYIKLGIGTFFKISETQKTKKLLRYFNKGIVLTKLQVKLTKNY